MPSYELTKIIGPIDFTGILVSSKLKEEFLARGHITLLDQGDDYDPSHICGSPLKLIEKDGEYLLYGKLFDGPDKNCKKAHRMAQILKQGRQLFAFKPILGKTADGEKHKLRVALVQTADKLACVTISPTLAFDEQPPESTPTIQKG